MSVAWVGAAASVVGGAMNARPSKKAAKMQADSAREATALQREQYEQTREDNAPFRERGNAAGNQLQYLMGLGGGTSGGTGGAGGAAFDRDAVRNQLLSKYTRTTNAGVAPTMPSSGWSPEIEPFLSNENIEANSGRRLMLGLGPATTIDETGLNADLDRQYQAFQDQQKAAQLAAQQDPNYGSLMRNFSAADRDADPLYAQLRPQIDSALARSANFETAPGYQFRMAEGMKGVENSGAARGMQLSGAGLKAINRFGQDFASNEYGNWFNQSNTDRNFVASQGDAAFNRFGTNRDSKYNKLAAIAGTGQTATNQVNTAGANYANQAGSNIMGAGNAQAAGIVGGANAVNQGIGQGMNFYQNNQLMDLIRNPNGRNSWGNSVAGGGRGGWNGTSNENFFYGNRGSGD